MEQRTRIKHKRPAHRKIRPVSKHQPPVKREKPYPIKYIVVHCTGTTNILSAKELITVCNSYHYLITRSGRLECLKPVRLKEQTIEVAWLGGIGKKGRHTDNRTEEQNETLFTTLALLCETFDTAEIVGADQLYPYGFANPGFDVKDWLKNYLAANIFSLL